MCYHCFQLRYNKLITHSRNPSHPHGGGEYPRYPPSRSLLLGSSWACRQRPANGRCPLPFWGPYWTRNCGWDAIVVVPANNKVIIGAAMIVICVNIEVIIGVQIECRSDWAIIILVPTNSKGNIWAAMKVACVNSKVNIGVHIRCSVVVRLQQ